MLIDWFTVGAQIVNFLVLVWLLRRYLYRPILNAIDAREQLIAKRLNEADAQQKEADRQQDNWRKKSEAIDQERGALLKQAQTEADAKRRELLENARREAEQRRASWHAALANEEQQVRRSISEKAQAEVEAQTRKALHELAGVELEQRIIDIFLQRLTEFAKRDSQKLAALWSSRQPLTVRSAFEIDATQRNQIERALCDTGFKGVSPQYAIDAKLIAGIEIIGDGHSLAWNLSDYLDAMGSVANIALTSKHPQAET